MTLRAECVLCLVLGVISLGGTAGVLADSSDEYTQKTPKELIDNAETFYWVAMAERGSITAIKLGLQYLKDAEYKLLDADPNTTRERDLLQREIDALRIDLESQENVHYNTHFGRFPLARLVTPTLFTDPRASGSFELIDDPDEVATREAVEELIDHVIEAQTVIPQFDVVFVSDPPSRALENEALYQFNRSSRFFVHNRRELARVLDVGVSGVDKIWPHGQLDPSTDVVRDMLDRWQSDGLFRSSHLLLVRVRKIDEEHGDFFYIAEGRIFEASDDGTILKMSSVLNQYGFCIDRRSVLWPILGLHAILLVVSLCLYPLLVKLTSHAGRVPTWQNTLIFGGLGFLWGRGVIWALAPVLAGMSPAPETLALWSFWWPAAAGAVFTLGPAIILGFADRRFNWFGSAFATFNRGGALFVSITLGSTSYLGQCALIYKGIEGWTVIPPLLFCTVVASFTVGRAFDKTDAMPLRAGILCAVLTLGLGIAWCSASTKLLWLTLIPLGAVLSVAARHASKPVPTVTHHEKAKAGTPTNSQELAERAYDPPFYESASFLKLNETLDSWREGNTVKVGLRGPAGAGKTAALNALEDKARQHYPGLIVLKGICHQPQAGSNSRPYQPFAEAIAEHFAVNLLAPHGDQMGQIDEALGGIFDHVVPFADILFPPNEQSQTGSRQELFTAISAMLRRLASQHPLMLVLDDVHWMDPASRELLEFLLVDFPESTECPLAILLASRAELKFAAGFGQAPVLSVEPLNAKELRGILVDGLGLDSALAAEVVGAAGQQRDNLHWLFQIIAHLAQQDLLVRRDDGFSWKDPGTRISEHLPDDIRQSLEQVIAENREFSAVLECAACMGREFSVDMISTCVGLPRLEMIHLLHHIEEQTGIVTDVREKDDHFAFRSSFFLEVLRQAREVHAGGPRDSSMPQRIREYHYRLASALEKTLDDSNSALYSVANHYYAAGARHADKALEYSVKAARAACFQFQHELARQYFAMAEDCVSFTHGSDVDLERELLLIHCHQSHVEGKQRVSTAQEAVGYLERHPDSDFSVYRTVAQASYDAGIDTRSQKYFVDCVSISQAMLERFSAPVEQAEADHFLGIGLSTSESDQRRQHLRTASDLVQKACDANAEDLDALRLKARIADSLAEQLSYGSPADREEARQLFELSIEIKQREDIRDLAGLAFAYGGLGRLAFFGDPPDFDNARLNFEEDLRYSEKIGSVTGQTKMHSLLGACILGEEKSKSQFEAARVHYAAAHAAAVERVDMLFALAGLLECHAALDHADTVAQFGSELYELVQNAVSHLPEEERNSDPVAAIPQMCRENVQTALMACQQQAGSQWHRWLTNLLTDTAPPS
jgi:hypothetical protein